MDSWREQNRIIFKWSSDHNLATSDTGVHAEFNLFQDWPPTFKDEAKHVFVSHNCVPEASGSQPFKISSSLTHRYCHIHCFSCVDSLNFSKTFWPNEACAIISLVMIFVFDIKQWISYLEADLEVITELRAAAQLAVETLVDKAVEFIGAIATVVVAVAQQCLIQAFFIVAHESWVIARPLWNHRQIAAYIRAWSGMWLRLYEEEL